VPIGYHQADLFGRSAAISFNTFDTFRGGESAYTFARLLATLRFSFGATSFSIEPFQLGQRNDEGLRSAAWWFYAKMGFHPRDARIKRLAEAESNRVHQDPRHRTSLRVLRRLATRHLFFDADPADPAPLMTPESIGLRAGAFLASLAPEDRDRALKLANRRARKACGLRSLEAWSKAERRAWDALCPLIAMLQVDHWSRAERQSLIALVKAKAAPSERGYAQKFAQHTRLQHALAQFAGAL
jgi:hypothetical protein